MTRTILTLFLLIHITCKNLFFLFLGLFSCLTRLRMELIINGFNTLMATVTVICFYVSFTLTLRIMTILN